MADYEKALADARDALAIYLRYGPPHYGEPLCGYATNAIDALDDLLAALDAARGEAVAFRAPNAQSWFPITDRKKLDELISAGHVFEFAYAAPPAALAVPADFTEWLAREMPAGTVIGDPQWWANMIARRFAQFAAPAQQPAAAAPEVLCTTCGHPTMHMGSMCYGCTQAGMLAAANKENTNG